MVRRSSDVVARGYAPVPARRPAPAATAPHWSRRRNVLSVFAAFAALGFVAAYIGPMSIAITDANAQERVSLYADTVDDAQVREGDPGAASEPVDLQRGSYSVYVAPKPTPTPTPTATSETSGESASAATWQPPFVNPDPGTAQAIAYEMVLARGWGDGEFACLVALWNRESGWRVNAMNPSSGAYGIPQSLPGSKMASAGADWETNPATQIAWGLGYIGNRYGTPCGAWGHSQSVGWY